MDMETLNHIITVVGVILSAFAAIFSGASYMRRKSYEILIKHRLDSLDWIRKDFSKLTTYLSPEKIICMGEQGYRLEAYDSCVERVICDLKM